MTTEKQTRVWVDVPLLDSIKEDYPETQGMTYAGTVDWSLRKVKKCGGK